MHARWPSSALFLFATASAGLAAPATSDGAKAIEQGYVEYFGKAVVDKGIVSVTPDGEDYLVSWDLQKAFDLIGPPEGALRIARFSYTLTPEDDGDWTAKADGFPSLAFDVPTDKGKVTGTLDLGGFRLETAYRAAQADFLRSLLSADTLAAKFHVPDGARGDDLDLANWHIGRDPRQDVRQRRRRRRRPRPIGQEPDRNRRRAAAGRSGPARRGDVYGRRLRRRRGDLGTARA